jgi:pSer/pThr/pTyr-binding forkhead associated (FHA) protein
MDEKQEILQKLLPVAVLKTKTPAAEQAVPQTILVDGLVAIRSFPFRVGRESRVKIVDGRVERIERERPQNTVPNNDLYLVDDGHLLNISREHFQIELDHGKFYLYDRGSACGTMVGDRRLGGEDMDETVELRDGDIITIGTRQSPYVYQFIVLGEVEVSLKE